MNFECTYYFHLYKNAKQGSEDKKFVLSYGLKMTSLALFQIFLTETPKKEKGDIANII